MARLAWTILSYVDRPQNILLLYLVVLTNYIISHLYHRSHQAITDSLSSFHEKLQERLSYNYPILWISDPRHCFLIYLTTKDPQLLSILQQLRNNLFGELWMALNSNDLFRNIHALDLTRAGRSQFLDPFRVVIDQILVHLEDVLLLTVSVRNL